jgi:alpha-L-rhamnosidase
MDAAAFLARYAYDLGKEQDKTGGMVPHIVPMVNLYKGGSAAWADVATILPWTLYEFYGDIDILEQQFESMCAWVDYIKDIDDSTGSRRLWLEGMHFGDWLSLDTPVHTDPRRGGTPHDLIASAFYFYSAQLAAKAAKVLGREEMYYQYQRLSEEIRMAFQQEYFSDDGRLSAPTQTAYVLVLFMDLVPETYREHVEKAFIERMISDNKHLRTGFVGTPYLCRVLSGIGAKNLAYRLLLNEDFPSWLYAVNLGATTIWERWDSLSPDGSVSSTGMNSFNHYACGSIVEWMYRDMCGLNPSSGDDKNTGFRHALITPKPDKSLKWAKARYRSAAGFYESDWHIDETGRLTIEIVIPFNASARVVLDDAELGELLINGQPLTCGEQIENRVELTLGAGRYRIEYLESGRGY